MAHSAREKVLLFTVTEDSSGDWLNVVPSFSLWIHLTSQKFIFSSRYRLGLPEYINPGPCPVPTCNIQMDIQGDHALACASSSERISQHDRLWDTIHNIASQAGLALHNEEQGLLDQSDHRLKYISIPFWTSGQDTALNIVVINPIQSNLLIKAASAPGAAAKHTSKAKLRKNYEDCCQIGVEFIPIAVKTWGGWHPRALTLIKKLSLQLARHLGKEESELHCHLW